MPTINQLNAQHPEYKRWAATWIEHRLFYKGGDVLLAAMRKPADFGLPNGHEILIKRDQEPQKLYNDRQRRAFALTYTGPTVDYFSSQCLQDPPVVTAAPDEGKERKEGEPPAGDLDEFYEEFWKNVDGAGHPLAEHLYDQLTHANIDRAAFALVEFPQEGDVKPANRAEEDALDLRDGKFVPIRRAQVLDWDTDKFGNLIFAVVKTIEVPRQGVEDTRKIQKHEWRVCTPGKIMLHKLDVDPAKPPRDDRDVPGVPIELRFDGFPLVRLLLPDGLWVAQKLHSAMRELFNKQNARGWQEWLVAYSMLAVFVKDPEILSKEAGESIIKVFGADDKAKWLENEGKGIVHLREKEKDLREESYRIVQQLHLAAPVTASQAQQSGEAKKRDKGATDTVCEAYGALLRKYLQQCLRLLASGRGETIAFEIAGLQEYDNTGAGLVDLFAGGTVDKIESPTARGEAEKQLVAKVLGVDPDVLAEINDEIDEIVKRKKVEAKKPAPVAPPVPPGGPAGEQAQQGQQPPGGGPAAP